MAQIGLLYQVAFLLFASVGGANLFECNLVLHIMIGLSLNNSTALGNSLFYKRKEITGDRKNIGNDSELIKNWEEKIKYGMENSRRLGGGTEKKNRCNERARRKICINTKDSQKDSPYVSVNTLIQPKKNQETQKKKVEPTESKTSTAKKDTDEVNIDLLTDDLIILAGAAYGEGSTKDVYEEMAGIASVLKRQREARGRKTFSEFFKVEKKFAFAVSDENQRYTKFIKSTNEQKLADNGMKLAIKAALNADNNGVDYSNGAYFWDGADIKSKYNTHPKVKLGIKFGDPSHNIYGIKEKKHPDAPVIEYWENKGKKTKERGRYEYTFISTAAYGGTIFWKYTDEYLNASGSKKYI